MKKIILLSTLFIFSFTFSQVGINTPTPQKTLHVNGALQVTNELNLGGNASAAGSAGITGQIIRSNGPGVAPGWVNLEEVFIPKTTIVGTKNSISPASGTFGGGTTNTVIFNSIPKIDNSNLTYNSTTGRITIVKAGYYQIVVYLTYDLNTNPNGETSGTASSALTNNTTGVAVARNTTNHSERTPYVFHNLVGTAYCSVGDQISVTGSHTRQYKLSSSSISAVYVSE
ncbi:hypothetical protein ACM39_05250 [Chryseobacterium sp. FH2]|uniref:hypothetical protein n=1 Tax=Chryseobacterium sp. FH2 TaxID=1674291 RepID=UPI00065AD3BD|nr:hypothetical protein [Chryseobacterium sp. FH2]KMQ68703.1 hypothetical protein ACM39_05250 [Chryseobacterium sp. FH2]